MDASLAPKPPFDPSAVGGPEPIVSSTKRRHNHPPPPLSSAASPSSIAFKPSTTPHKISAGETLFRILCPGTRTGGVIGKRGAVIRQVREETGAKIRIDECTPGCEERVILIIADSTLKESNSTVDGKPKARNVDSNGKELENLASNSHGEHEGSPAQQALIRVFDRMVRMSNERSGVSGEVERGERETEEGDNVTSGGTTPQAQGHVVCRLLAPSNQVGCVLGRGGKIVEKIRHDTGAQVRVLSKDQIPACAHTGDELIQITGSYSAVRKALLSVSGCLQDNPRTDAANTAAIKSSGMALHGAGLPAPVDPSPQQGDFHSVDFVSRGYLSAKSGENIGANHGLVIEEEVVFRLLCQIEKVGSLIGKGGSIVRALQNETGASIKVADAPPDSDEKVVVIAARESLEQRHSPAQEAVIRVHCRIAEIGFEPGAAIVARLLVPSQQIGCLLGKGGFIVAELRRVTGASIRIFPREQVPKCGSQNDEVVQVIGSLQSVQDALFQITGRIRETIFTVKPHHTSVSGSPFIPPYPEISPPLFRPRHDPASPGGFPRGVDRAAIPGPSFDPQPFFSHGKDHFGPAYSDRAPPYAYSGERPGHGPPFNIHSSPRKWTSQGFGVANPRGVADVGGGLSSSNVTIRSGSEAPITASTTVEVVIPQTLIGYVYGENNGNLDQIRQVSGAKVNVHSPRPGTTEGVFVLSGTSDQTRAAQSLIQAFVLSEQPF